MDHLIFRSTVSFEETSFTYHVREIPKHSFRRGDLIQPYHVKEIPKHSFRPHSPLSCRRDSEAQFPSRRPHLLKIMSERSRSTVSFEETTFTPYHVRGIPKHSFLRGTTYTPIISEIFWSTVSVLHDIMRYRRMVLCWQCT